MSQLLRLPLASEYREAIESTALCFKDPALHGGVPLLDQLGLPRPISGNNASVFNIAGGDGRRWAVKCFTRCADDQERRYGLISSRLSQLQYPWRVGFDFLHNGILVQGKWYPVLKMEWVEGIGLTQFIETHLWEPHIIAAVAKNFANMAFELRHEGIAHGDLQHGNLMIGGDGQLRLIDYDGMFVPGLESLGANERGHDNYQSPARTLSEWGPHLDQFSAWVIYVSLIAITIDPTLWGRLRADGDECLLFRKEDYLNPQNSSALFAFRTTGDDRLNGVATTLGRLWSADITTLPPLQPEDLPPPVTTPITAGPVPPVDTSVGQGLPTWMTAPGGTGNATTAPPPVPASSDWMSSYIPPLPRVRFHSSVVPARFAVALIALAVAAVGGMALVEIVPLTVTVAAVVISIPVLLLIVGLFYRYQPERKSRTDSRSRLHRRQAEARLARTNMDRIMENRRRLDANERRDCDRLAKRQEEVRRNEQSELAKINAELARHTSEIAARRQSLHSAESTERGNTLRVLQDQYVHAQLGTRRVGSSKLAGIGQNLIWNLNQAGIHTAADFTGVSIGRTYSGRYTREVAHIHLRNGRMVHVEGIGPKKANTLDGWRRSLESAVRASQPTQLSATQAAAIVQKYENQRKSLANEETAARTRSTQRSTDVRRRSQTSQAELIQQLQAVRQQAAHQRAVIDSQLLEAGRESHEADWRLSQARRAFDAYTDVRYRNYLRRVIAG